MITSIDHAVLYTRDMKTALEFYSQKLGLKIRTESEQWSEVSTEDGNSYIGLHPSKSVSLTKNDTTEIVFKVPNINETRKTLEEKGVQFYDDIKSVGSSAWFTSFLDPDGNRLSIYSNKNI
ncbi:MAG: VOC family protein [Candidatus Kariarchaeaceae archaeon]|jgi:predicted enzyme related to lactoylglutathione lyase